LHGGFVDTIDREAVLAAHDALHKGDAEACHELLHKAIQGAGNDLPIAPLGHLGGFDASFATACRKRGVRAAYIAIDPASRSADGRVRLIVGGDLELARFLDGLRGQG